MSSMNWQELVADKRRRQQESIPQDWRIIAPPDDVLNVIDIPERCGLLTPREIEITNTQDVETILSKLASREWSSVEVTLAFYKRAIVAQQLVNCLTEIFVERALHRAKELDDHLCRTGKVVGPLHGLPVSMKDQLCIKGLETTIGYASLIGTYAERDAALVEILYENGAIPFVRTNLPQTIMWPETHNNIFGRTLNPYNRMLTSGGSSGGEGALIALRGSPLGIGSDLGGSVRIPCNYNGLYGLRPSYGRVPYEGALNSLEGSDSVLSTLGPMSNSLGGIKIFMKAVIDSKPWKKDPLAVHKTWDADAYNLTEHGGGKRLCFGIMWNDRDLMPHPPIIRALQMARAALTATGHEVIEWEPINHKEMNDIVKAIWGAAALQDFKVATSDSGEPLLTTLLPEIASQSEVTPPRFPGPETGISAYQLWQLHKRKRELRKEYLDHWEKTVQITSTGRPIDAIISPVSHYPPPPHGRSRTAQYTRVQNFLDYPAITLPVTRVEQVLDIKKQPHAFFNDMDKAHYEMYDPVTFKDAPINLQLVGRTLEEEALIAMAEIVDAALKTREQTLS